ncbi:sigma-70 family RNA polymerase sigma factor [Glycomyces xiaoerkulensis]|uniref:sigma-70 family RNA polymerase sigma factor n=1 Tax=Glycomyces xiaoerkulensis TaxID=2038139 RepID=UPI000C26A35D|nr:sigma-70 family RNA polymerase sigma factor [Glycomyces xiaoerkulensis]
MPETFPAGDSPSVDSPHPDVPGQLSDPELIAATRAGDTTAYAVLYERHIHAARRLARVLAQDVAAADDLVSETFAKLLHTLQEGRGPELAFRPYMLRTLRNTFYDRVRRDKRIEYTDDLSQHDSGEIQPDPAVEGQERRYAALAFGKLPERWQMVLWHTEVEEEPPAKVAAMLGMTANGVSALAYRAREKLRQNYLTEHAADAPPDRCRWTVDRLGARVRGKLASRDAAQVDEHLDGCVSCNLLFAELSELNSGLRLILAPIVLGASATPYLAAGVASAAGVAVGGVLGTLAAPFVAVGNWIRRIFQQFGTKGSTAVGTAAAVAAALAVFALTSGEPEEQPQATDDPPAATEDDPVAEPEPEPEDDPDDPAPEEPGPDDPPDEPPPGADPEDPEDPPDETESDDPPAEEPETYTIAHDLGNTGLVAGGEGVLPIVLEEMRSGGGYVPSTGRATESGGTGTPAAWGQTATSNVKLDVTLPDGITLASSEAAPGWKCDAAGADVRCTIGEMPDPAEARVRVDIADRVTGFQTFTVAVDGPDINGTTELRIAVAPAGAEVGYAGLEATGVTASGNTWLTCSLPGCREGAEGGIGDRYPMKPYKPGRGHPQPPAGQDGESVSGAVLDVPAGSEVLWAGLYWAGVDDDLPSDVSLAGPDGSWTDLSAGETTDTDPGRQAFVEVTDLVDGGGEHWVAVDNHRLPSSKCKPWHPRGHPHCTDPQWAGWSITVVFAESGAEKREVAVYDGAPSDDAEIGVRGPGEVTVAHTLWGGSAYNAGDSHGIGGHNLGQPARSRANGALNNPHWYTFGVDVAVHTVDLDEDGVIRYSRGDDPFIVGVVAVAGPID